MLRRPAVAGSFYPANPKELASTVDFLLEAARAEAAGLSPKALIAPHAGYVYSGPVAASAYAELWKARHGIERVVLLGPSHRVPLEGLAASQAEAFLTPLGPVPLDPEARQIALALPQVQPLEVAHEREHSLEVHLPFLQRMLERFRVIPLVVGVADPEVVCEVLEALWGDRETRIVVSSDLSHYLDYETARGWDQETSRAIERLDPAGIHPAGACGCYPVRGLLLAAQHHGLRARTLDLRSSGDTAGPRSEVVGYGAYAFH
ncbi:MAG: AmmeMemoRadiSam system protein B [Myxococcota bacterium]